MIRQFVTRPLGFISRLIASRTQEGLLFQPVLQEVQQTSSLRPVDVRKFAQIYAGWEAGEFYCKYLYNAEYYENYVDHVRAVARRAAQSGPGAILEFGVASGITLTAIAESAGRPVVGFDWFQGLPEDWRHGVGAGSFAGKIPELPANASLQISRIEEKLPDFLSKMEDTEIRLLHIDTDLYTPANVILTACEPYMNHTFIIFDEFFNYPGWRDHEYKAFSEFQNRNQDMLDTQYIGLGGQVAVSALVTRRTERGTIGRLGGTGDRVGGLD